MISLLLECMRRLSNWISKANNISNKNLVDKSCCAYNRKTSEAPDLGPQKPELCSKPPKVTQQTQRYQKIF